MAGESFLDEMEDEAPSTTALDEVMALVDAWKKLLDDVAEKEAALKEAVAKERKMSEEILPGIFLQNKLERLFLDNGMEVFVKEDLSAGVPADPDKAKAAMEWLSLNGGGDLIKDTLAIIDPPKNILDILEAQSIEFDRAKKVNAAQLKAWLREALGMKKNTLARFSPSEIAPELGLYRYRKVHVKGEK